MVTSQTFPLVSEATLEELSERGQAIYDALRAQLEPEHDGEYIVIHTETGDYAVGPTFSRTNRTMLARHGADGKLFGRRIGQQPDEDSLVGRLSLPGSAGERQK